MSKISKRTQHIDFSFTNADADTKDSFLKKKQPDREGNVVSLNIGNIPGDRNKLSQLNTYMSAEYLADMLKSLRSISDESDFNFLSYLIDMAYQEAVTQRDRAVKIL